MGCSFKKMGRMDATLFVHPAQQTDCNSQKRKVKWTVNSTSQKKDSDIVSRWIYIQRPASIFNLSSSSSSAAGTTSHLLLLAALLSTLRYEALLHRWPGHPSTPPVHLHRLPNHTALEPVNPRTPLHLRLYSRVFPSSARCCPGPPRRQPPWMCSAWRGQRMTPSEVDCAWRG